MRTALNDTRYISPVSDTVIANVVSTSKSVATSVLCPCSEEVAAPLVTETTQTQTRNRIDSGVVVSSDSSPEPQLKVDNIDSSSETNPSSSQSVVTSTDDGIAKNETVRNKDRTSTLSSLTNMLHSSQLIVLRSYGLLDTKSYYEMKSQIGDERITSTADLLADMAAAKQANRLKTANGNNEGETGIAPLNNLKEQNGSSKDSSSDTADKAEGSSPSEDTSSLDSFSATLFGLKKRRKKGHSKKPSTETDKPGKIRQRDVVLENEIADSCLKAKHSRDTTNDDESRTDGNPFDENRLSASRAIAEVPDVAVLDGGSFVPTDLCSTRVLTSRVLTAPSRATYTTAYI